MFHTHTKPFASAEAKGSKKKDEELAAQKKQKQEQEKQAVRLTAKEKVKQDRHTKKEAAKEQRRKEAQAKKEQAALQKMEKAQLAKQKREEAKALYMKKQQVKNALHEKVAKVKQLKLEEEQRANEEQRLIQQEKDLVEKKKQEALVKLKFQERLVRERQERERQAEVERLKQLEKKRVEKTASIEAAWRRIALKQQQQQKEEAYTQKIQKKILVKEERRLKIKESYKSLKRSFSVLLPRTKRTIVSRRGTTFYLGEHKDAKKPKNHSSSGFCAICLQKSVGCCSTCRDQFYCSRKCQRRDWTGKKEEESKANGFAFLKEEEDNQEEEEEMILHKEVCRASQDPRTVHTMMYRAREMSDNSRQLLFKSPQPPLPDKLRKYCNIRPGSIFSCIVASNDRYEFTEMSVEEAMDEILERCTLYINTPPPNSTGKQLYDEVMEKRQKKEEEEEEQQRDEQQEEQEEEMTEMAIFVEEYTDRLRAGGCIVYCLGNNQNEDLTEKEFMPFCIFDPISRTIYNSIYDVYVDNEDNPFVLDNPFMLDLDDDQLDVLIAKLEESASSEDPLNSDDEK